MVNVVSVHHMVALPASRHRQLRFPPDSSHSSDTSCGTQRYRNCEIITCRDIYRDNCDKVQVKGKGSVFKRIAAFLLLYDCNYGGRYFIVWPIDNRVSLIQWYILPYTGSKLLGFCLLSDLVNSQDCFFFHFIRTSFLWRNCKTYTVFRSYKFISHLLVICISGWKCQ